MLDLRTQLARLAVVLGVLSLSSGSAHGQVAAPIELSVDLAERTAPTALRPGFLKGFRPPRAGNPRRPRLPESLDELKPGFWRIGQEGWALYPELARFDPKISLSLQELYYDAHGSFQARPWQEGPEWVARWRAFCAEQARRSLRESKPVDYWTVWNEPDSPEFGATWEQLLEIHRSAALAVRGVDSDARIVGPNVADVENLFPCGPDARCRREGRGARKSLFDFLQALAEPPYDTRLDAIAWHEFLEPAEVLRDAARLREFLSDRSRFDPAYEAELHLTEYGNSVSHVLPGFAVGFIDAAERAGIEWLTRACWDVQEGRDRWSGCGQGLNGLYLRDLETPQNAFYIYAAYARLTRPDAPFARVATTSPTPQASALAGLKPGTREVFALVGIHGYERTRRSAVSGAPLQLVVRGYPADPSEVDVVVRALTHRAGWFAGIARIGRGRGPELVYSGREPIQQGRLRISLPDAEWGAAYLVEVSAPISPAASPSPGAGSANGNGGVGG